MGRPSTYDSNKPYLKLADKYLASCGREQTKLPKISEFCREYLGVSEDTAELWLKGENLPKDANIKELIGAIKKVRESQKEQLMDDGMYGGKEVNSAMPIFLLKVNHGMVEIDRHEHEIKGNQNINVLMYGQQDPLFNYISSQFQPNGIKSTSPNGHARPAPISSPQLASESKKNDTGDKSVDKMGK